MRVCDHKISLIPQNPAAEVLINGNESDMLSWFGYLMQQDIPID